MSSSSAWHCFFLEAYGARSSYGCWVGEDDAYTSLIAMRYQHEETLSGGFEMNCAVDVNAV